jgi:RNA recognition motif-containing protein
VLEFRIHETLSSLTGGYLVYSDPSDASKAYDALQGFILNDSSSELYPTLSIEEKDFDQVPLLKAKWYTTNSKGVGYIKYKTINKAQGSLEGLRITFQNNYSSPSVSVNIDKKSADTVYIKGFNLLINDIELKAIASNFGAVASASVPLQDMENVDYDDQMYDITLRSLFSTYGEIDIMDLLPPMKTKKVPLNLIGRR